MDACKSLSRTLHPRYSLYTPANNRPAGSTPDPWEIVVPLTSELEPAVLRSCNREPNLGSNETTAPLESNRRIDKRCRSTATGIHHAEWRRPDAVHRRPADPDSLDHVVPLDECRSLARSTARWLLLHAYIER
ncbi:hypothetical protein HII31_01176 [Pseudocercospora fuligena]|uniref:Uncharacterized protein n=1 Tax=Pseudocercospora fuligena TaxID=685502 RepID=A0A8H6RUF9_9PEZI|nr:hypothetical protein HII31_01176 [Pseudocercospora fuligena]